jgi:hypothetical protein
MHRQPAFIRQPCVIVRQAGSALALVLLAAFVRQRMAIGCLAGHTGCRRIERAYILAVWRGLGTRPGRTLPHTILLRLQQGLDMRDGFFRADVLDRRI